VIPVSRLLPAARGPGPEPGPCSASSPTRTPSIPHPPKTTRP